MAPSCLCILDVARWVNIPFQLLQVDDADLTIKVSTAPFGMKDILSDLKLVSRMIRNPCNGTGAVRLEILPSQRVSSDNNSGETPGALDAGAGRRSLLLLRAWASGRF
ncbi:hypothetical protein PISMIDRAFT_676150 [Pisolithus microcarpus 441]|uniref:Uncharacterized protein n=1 Tax=Pisolithus microcarpus 441 TaxID=765257 RepID=A0A0C9ZK56_9AGAM|nr:hypothetical protein PISMIDRAFT_676150 [Pisolithus microcarpus 441]